VDEGLNGRVSYRLISGDYHGHFVLDSDHGTLRVAAPLDREQVTVNMLPAVEQLFSVLPCCSANTYRC